MTTPADMAVVLLAAGKSRRFGGNKLAALLNGAPLIHHTARTLCQIGCETMLVVSSDQTPDLAAFGFESVKITSEDEPLSASISMGIERAMQREAKSVLIALSDMPLVPAAHYRSLIDAFLRDGDRVGTKVQNVLQPPAIFDRQHFDRLKALPGHAGAKAVLIGAKSISLDEDLARDIDTIEQLAKVQTLRN